MPRDVVNKCTQWSSIRPAAPQRTSEYSVWARIAAALDASADELLGIKSIKMGKKPDTQHRLQRIEKLDPKAKRQITQLPDTSIEREEPKQRVNAQGDDDHD